MTKRKRAALMAHAGAARVQKQLVVLGCSATKVTTEGFLPAIDLYDGPTFRVLRSFLRDYHWPQSLSVAVLSAKYGIIGGLSHITAYDLRMTLERAAELAKPVSKILHDWSHAHYRIDLVLGQDYLPSIDPHLFSREAPIMQVVAGAIGIKLSRLRDMLHALNPRKKSPARTLPELSRPLYFLPDWDGFLDVDYDFEKDKFSSEDRATRHEEHSITLMRPQRLCAGVLVSLAQNFDSKKGMLKRMRISNQNYLSPRSVRAYFNLRDDQWAFGDCGAFSYVSEDKPTLSVEQAVALYDLYAFALGASVDHISVTEFATPRGTICLSEDEQRRRVTLTRDNADQFLKLHRERRRPRGGQPLPERQKEEPAMKHRTQGMVAVLLACVGLLSGGRAEAAQGGLPQCIAELAVCHTQLTAAQGDLAQGTNDLASTDDRFVDNGDGTITDNQTGLMWEKKSSGASTSHDGQGVGNCLQCVDDTYPWAVAMSEWLSALNGRTDEPSTQTGYAGHSDWRLPTFVELQTITVPSGGGSEPCVAPIFNTNCMPGCTVTSCSCTEPSGYWSSTTSDDPSSAWLINFEFCGDAFLTDKSVGLLVRAVRRAQ